MKEAPDMTPDHDRIQTPPSPVTHPAPTDAQLPQDRKDSRKRKRGIVLLMVVSLLALFILMGVTYALIANQYLYATKLEVQVQQKGDPPDTETDRVLDILLADTTTPGSLQNWSLLRHLYGYDANINVANPTSDSNITKYFNRETFFGEVQQVSGGPSLTMTPVLPPNGLVGGGAAPNIGGQFLVFEFDVPTTATTNATALSPIPNYYAGRVITFLTGPAANHSTRIVAYNPFIPPGGGSPSYLPGTPPFPQTTPPTPPARARGQFIIEAIESKLNGSVTSLIAMGHRFVVNGAPFNGAGPGYDMTS